MYPRKIRPADRGPTGGGSPGPGGTGAGLSRAVGSLLRITFLTILSLGVLSVVISPGLAEHFVFFPDRSDPGPAPRLGGIRGEDVDFAAADGTRLHGWWHEAAPGAPAVLFLHGNAGNIRERAPIASGYLERGVSVFMPDYRGYGRSEGRPSEEGVQLDARAAADWLRTRLGPGTPMVVHGRSLGGAIGSRLAADRSDVAGVILESTFTSLEEMARVAYPFLPGFALRRLRGHFDTRAAVARLEVPLLLVHGTADRLIPVALGRDLHGGAPPGAEWYEIPGAGHNDGFWVGGEAYFDRVAGFVRAVARREGGS